MVLKIILQGLGLVQVLLNTHNDKICPLKHFVQAVCLPWWCSLAIAITLPFMQVQGTPSHYKPHFLCGPNAIVTLIPTNQ